MNHRSILARKPSRLAIALAAGSLALASCGGGGGSPTPTPGGGGGGGGGGGTVTISLTSPAAVSVAENSKTNVYTATATASNGQPVTFEIFSGSDGDKFTASGGVLSFVAAPDFERPTDANRDNVYQVSLRATAGTVSTTFTINVTVTNDKEGVQVRRIATGFSDPVGMSSYAGNRQLLIAQKDGAVFVVDGSDGSRERSAVVDGQKEPGSILAVAYRGTDPELFKGIYLLVQSSTRLFVQAFAEGRSRVEEFSSASNIPTTGSLFVGGEGSVYAAIGDPDGRFAQDPRYAHGKFVRLNPENPYSGASVPRAPYFKIEIIGDGIHAPGGGGMIGTLTAFADRAITGEEEVTGFDHRARPLDFGFPFYEGGIAVRSNPPPSVNEPMIAYPHGTGPTAGQGVVFGASYTRTDIPSLRDHYVWADVDGTFWSIPLGLLLNGFRHLPEDFHDRTADFAPDAGAIGAPVAIARDRQGVLYILDADGELFRLDAA